MSSWETVHAGETVHTQRLGAAVRLELYRPRALNAFDAALLAEFGAAVRSVSADRDVRAVLLTGAGRAFCAGADLDLDASDDVDLAEKTRSDLREGYNPMIRALRSMDKPVVAAVNGPAVGVGCSIAMACDLVVASDHASFALAFSRVGLTPDGGASLLLGARAGLGRASRLALLAEKIDAARAVELGIADELVPAEELDARATELTTRLAAGPTAAYAATKRALNAALLPGLDAALDLEAELQSALAGSADFAEGAAAFAERRAPLFRGGR